MWETIPTFRQGKRCGRLYRHLDRGKYVGDYTGIWAGENMWETLSSFGQGKDVGDYTDIWTGEKMWATIPSFGHGHSKNN